MAGLGIASGAVAIATVVSIDTEMRKLKASTNLTEEELLNVKKIYTELAEL